MRPSDRFLPVALALALLAAPAFAADKPASKSGGKLLTRDELRACMQQEQGNKARADEIVKFQAELDQGKTAISQEDAALKAAVAGVNPDDEAAVTALKARAQALDDQIDAYNRRLPQFNDLTQSLEASRAEYKAKCADRKYDEKDYFAIKRGK